MMFAHKLKSTRGLQFQLSVQKWRIPQGHTHSRSECGSVLEKVQDEVVVSTDH